MNILPPPQKDGEIKFLLAKSVPYRPRMALVVLCLAAGLGLQVTAGFWLGYPLLLLGLLLGFNTGYDSTPRETGAQAWERVTPDEYEKVRLKTEQLRAWDEDIFDGTSSRGGLGLVVAAGICVVLYKIAAEALKFPPGSFIYFALDAAVVIIPLWFAGTRGYLKKDKLLVKIGALRKVMDALTDSSEVQVQPMLSLADTESGGKEPEDARLMVKLVGAPKEFYGLQVQVSINSVQGTDYPYLYCVLIAKSGSGLLKDYEDLTPRSENSVLKNVAAALFSRVAAAFAQPELVYEPSAAGEVDIIVVRQQTTRDSGYSTPPAAAQAIVEGSLKLARSLLAKNSAPVPAPQADRGA